LINRGVSAEDLDGEGEKLAELLAQNPVSQLAGLGSGPV
jgi:hypothetical protein